MKKRSEETNNMKYRVKDNVNYEELLSHGYILSECGTEYIKYQMFGIEDEMCISSIRIANKDMEPAKKGDIWWFGETILEHLKPQNNINQEDVQDLIDTGLIEPVDETQVLTNKEKIWINNFVESTDITVYSIEKIRQSSSSGSNLKDEYLQIEYLLKKGEDVQSVNVMQMPPFEANSMYQGMDILVKYEAKDLKLDELEPEEIIIDESDDDVEIDNSLSVEDDNDLPTEEGVEINNDLPVDDDVEINNDLPITDDSEPDVEE